MSIAAGIQAPVNGLPPRPTEANEVREYEKILDIYNQVVAGNHPRLRLSGSTSLQSQAQLVPQASQVPVKAVSAAPPPISRQKLPVPSPELQSSNSAQDSFNYPASLNGSAVISQPVPPKPLMSELDPIFLTKSDDLVRAEIKLQRQRAERVLREQLEQKRADARHKPSVAEAKPEFDVADVLTKALALVKPVVFDESRGIDEHGSASDSFDENSFYSSKAPDSTPRDGDDSQKSSTSKPQVQPVDNDNMDADGLVDRPSDEVPQVDLTNSPYKVVPRPATYSTAHSQYFRHDADRPGGERPALAPIALDEDEEEPEYSPPGPAHLPQLRDGRNSLAGDGHVERGRRANGRQNNHHPNSRRYESPGDLEVRIVRSHITSPVAPQPSRVSPLAIAKGPPISQNRRNRQEQAQRRRFGGAESERTSPDMATSTNQPRKKRKIQELRKGDRRRALVSPDPVIKDEPVSPPPFHDVPPLGATRHRQAPERPIYIDVEPSRDVPLAPERRPEQSTRQIIYDADSQAPHSAPRVLSRAGLRDGPRANQDLRRVVSVQNLPAREFVEPAYPTPTRISRAPSYAPSEGVGRGQEARLFDRPAQLYERQHIGDTQPLLSPAYREVELDQQYTAQPMAPPPQRRIVVDEYGNRFYEAPQAPRASVAPVRTRLQETESYNERATIRNDAAGAASVLEEPPRETRYVQEMRPPQMIYRRVAENVRPATADYRYVTEAPRPAPAEVRYITREPLETRPAPRSGSVQVYDYPARQPTYLDENVPPRETIVRVASVRPTARPYEEAQEVFQRVQSVRPEARELSVLPEDAPRIRREEVPVDGPLYEVRRTAEGDKYYRIDDGGRMLVERSVDTRPAYAPRY